MKRSALLLVFVLIAAMHAVAQTGVDGAILGVVTDANGGAVAGATVMVTDLETSIQKIMTSRSDGSFEINALPQGPYSVTVTFSGFKTWSLAKTDLTVGERKRVSPVLQVGEVNEKVTVEATTDLLQTEKVETGGVVEQRTIQELPLNGRDVVELTELVPGVRYGGRSFATACADGNTSSVQGLGHRDDQTEFRVDGVASNAVCDEGSTAIPNPDTIAEFNVSTSNFSAENGRNPLQVNMVTKSGTNDFHATLWEFLRNDALDARNTFADSNPKLRQNQFGVAGGGPVLIPKIYNGKNKTFFFGSYEGTRITRSKIYNSYTVSPAMMQGDFSGLPAITDPLTGQPFPDNKIPDNRISSASKFFFPWIPQANSAGQTFKAIASTPVNNDEFTGRVDHQITQNQRIYWRYLHIDTPQYLVGYLPSSTATEDTHTYSTGLTYDYTVTPTTLLNLSIGTVGTVNTSSPTCNGNGPCTEIGKENLTADAGIQGFQTAGREQWIGLPDSISFAGYAGISSRNGWGDPSTFKSQSINGSASVNLVRGRHTIVTGYQYDHLYLLAAHGSCCSKGVFDFSGQYTGNGFADYLLGYTDASLRNYPIHTFGMKSNPYGALFVDDSWKVTPQLTLELGLRWDYWFAKTLIRGAGGTFDPKSGKAVAGLDSKGQVDLTAQPVSQYLAAATQGQWVPASDLHIPGGLFQPSGYVSPRLGAAWRPLKSGDLVIRAGFGVFTSSYRGNITASQIIAPPYWTYESQSWSPAQLQRWETAWPVNPNSFTASSVGAAAYDVKPMKDYEWNISIQKTLKFKTAVTASYVGSKATDLVVDNSLNNVAPGLYTDLQAAKPYPIFGSIDLYKNTGGNHYNAGQLKVERRFSQGLSFMLSYSFSKNISEAGGDGVYATPTPFAPEGYNRGRAAYDHTHILATNLVWEIPVGRGRAFGGSMSRLANAAIGGWELSGIYLFSSGDPLSFSAPGGTLGNGWGTRANLVGDPHISNPSAGQWFNPAAFSAPGPYLFGNSGIGIIDGPGSHVVNLGFMKKFEFAESRYLQLRWEAFNAFNHVNLGDPNTTINQGSTGQIFYAGDARVMQVALKLVF
ncbi:MAG: carboxypeptidase regulatory-like domain-containing protein [Bryobacteraceae bacterium]